MLRKSCLLTSGQSHLTEQWLDTDNELQPILRSSGLKQMMSTAKFPTGLLRGIFSNNWIQLLTQQYRGHKTIHLNSSMAWLWKRIALDWQWGERCRPTSMLFFYHGADLHVLQAAFVVSSILSYDRIQ